MNILCENLNIINNFVTSFNEMLFSYVIFRSTVQNNNKFQRSVTLHNHNFLFSFNLLSIYLRLGVLKTNIMLWLLKYLGKVMLVSIEIENKQMGLL